MKCHTLERKEKTKLIPKTNQDNKHDETRRKYMTYETELKQWKRKCLAEGKKKAKEEIIINLAQIHMPKETIAQVTRSSISYVEEVIQNTGK